MHRRRLPITSPCTEDSAEMQPIADAVWHCSKCERAVYDLSAMTRADARALLGQPRPDGMCVRYRVDRRDRIEFADTPVRRSVARWPGLAVASMVGVLVVPQAGRASGVDEVREGIPVTDAEFVPIDIEIPPPPPVTQTPVVDEPPSQETVAIDDEKSGRRERVRRHRRPRRLRSRWEGGLPGL